MVVWCGEYDNVASTSLNTGSRYSPVNDVWRRVSGIRAPSGRYLHTSVWTGNLMIVWGGLTSDRTINNGGAYAIDPFFVDGDGDGLSECLGDCNDGNAAVHPGAPEICDAADNDCNGVVDAFTSSCGVGGCFSTGFCTAGVDSCVPGAPSFEVCDNVDNDCDGFVDNALVPSGPLSVAIAFTTATPILGWSVLPGATAYDVVMGDLSTLVSTGGDFTAAIRSCLADDLEANALSLDASPPAGSGFFYLVRGVNWCAGAGTYDSGDATQVGSRDSEIDASPLTCTQPLPAYCGDDVCNGYEDSFSCPYDCYCGDAVCDPTEDCFVCSSDCC